MLVYQRVYSSNPRYLHISTCISQSWSTKLKFSSFYLQPWFASNSQHFWGFTSLEGLAEGAKPKCLETTDLRKASREHSGERRCLAHSRWSTSEMSFPESFPVENGWLPTCCNICTGGSKSKCALRNRKSLKSLKSWMILDDYGWFWSQKIYEHPWKHQLYEPWMMERCGNQGPLLWRSIAIRWGAARRAKEFFSHLEMRSEKKHICLKL